MKMPAAESFTLHADFPMDGHPLSDLERRVVHLGRSDADRGDRGQAGRTLLARAFAMLTGVRHVQPLAEERLEMLRRFACTTRRGDTMAQALAAELRGCGFSADALGTASAMARR